MRPVEVSATNRALFRSLSQYEKTSESGNHYFQGRWGSAKVLLSKSRDMSESGEPIWELKLAQTPQRIARRFRIWRADGN